MQKLAFFIFILGIFLTGCRSKVVPEGPWIQKIDSWELSRMVIYFSAEMKSIHHLDLEDSYAAYDDNIKKIYLRYSSQRLLTLYEARALIVDLVEGFLEALNSNSVVGFELDTYPFTAHDLDVRINFESFYGKYCDEQYMGIIWLQHGCVSFFAFDRKDLLLDWDHDRIEPYAKSRELALIKKDADMTFTEEVSVLKNDREETFVP
jgi:hypothetical protein